MHAFLWCAFVLMIFRIVVLTGYIGAGKYPMTKPTTINDAVARVLTAIAIAVWSGVLLFY